MIRNLLASTSDRRAGRSRARRADQLRARSAMAVLVAIFALALTATPSLRAAWLDAPYVDLPQARINRSGLRIQLDWYGARHPGYQPVRIKVLTANGVPSGRDRELDVRLHPFSYGAGGPVMVHKTIVLPKGAVSVDDVISIPINQQLGVLSTEVFENGKELREFEHQGFYSRQYGFEESLPSILIVGANAPTRDQFNRINQTSRFGSTAFDEFEIPEVGPLSSVAAGNYYEPLYNSSSKTIDYLTYLHTSNTQLSVLHPDDLPDRWIDLTCYEVVILGWDDLTALRTARPEAFAALRDWTLGGRTLMVYGLGDGLETLPELEKALEVPATDWPAEGAPVDSLQAGASASSAGWIRPQRTLRNTNLALWASSQGYRGSYQTTTATPPTETTPADASSQPDEFVLAARKCHFGYVVAIGNEDPFPGTPDDWRWAFNAVPANHLSWSQKHGMSYADVNVPFWRHRIPGVGVAPVWTFLALITAFVAIIGPANYFYLARRKRLALLLLTVPVGSFAIILGLFAYAFLNDGLGVRSRIRSYSIVDSQAGRTYSWSWQTYFAGVAPSQGILLDESCYYAPLFFDPVTSIAARGQFEIDWNDDAQRLARGYFPSRTMSQFVANGVREGTYRLDVNFPEGGGDPEVENLLGTDLPFLVCVGPDGTLYSAPGVVEKEAKAKLVKLSATEAAEVFDRFVKAAPLEIPEGVDAEALRSSQYRNGFFGWIMGMDYYYYNTSGTAPTNVNATKFEEGIQQARTTLERSVPPMQPGTYYAVAEAPPWIPYAVEDHSREMNLDVVFGRFE